MYLTENIRVFTKKNNFSLREGELRPQNTLAGLHLRHDDHRDVVVHSSCRENVWTEELRQNHWVISRSLFPSSFLLAQTTRRQFTSIVSTMKKGFLNNASAKGADSDSDGPPPLESETDDEGPPPLFEEDDSGEDYEDDDEDYDSEYDEDEDYDSEYDDEDGPPPLVDEDEDEEGGLNEEELFLKELFRAAMMNSQGGMGQL